MSSRETAAFPNACGGNSQDERNDARHRSVQDEVDSRNRRLGPNRSRGVGRSGAMERWLASGIVALLTAAASGCAMQPDAAVIPEIEPAGAAPPGAEPTEVDPEGDDAAERAR